MRELFEKLYKKSEEELFELLEDKLVSETKTFVVTANPEIFMNVNKQSLLYKNMMDESCLITPDAEGMVMGARKLGYKLWGKTAGVDTVEEMFRLGNIHHSKLYIFGSKQEVLDALKSKLNKEYPNLKIVGLKNGYNNDPTEVAEDMIKQEPDIILTALGVPRQEEFISDNLAKMKKGIFIGCGGSLDVLSGTKKRAPKIFIKLKLEWFYRIAKEPKRIKRFYDNNIKYLLLINKMAKENK